MVHIYALVEGQGLVYEAVSKGRTDYSQPSDNRQVMYSLDGTKVIVEGLLTDDEISWFELNCYVFEDVTEVQQYIQNHYSEWYLSSE